MRIVRAVTGGSFYALAVYATCCFGEACFSGDYINQPYWYFIALGAIIVGSVVLP